jgi:hypothetical protein
MALVSVSVIANLPKNQDVRPAKIISMFVGNAAMQLWRALFQRAFSSQLKAAYTVCDGQDYDPDVRPRQQESYKSSKDRAIRWPVALKLL